VTNESAKTAFAVIGVIAVSVFLTLTVIATWDLETKRQHAEEEKMSDGAPRVSNPGIYTGGPSQVMTWKWEVSNVTSRFPDPKHMDDMEDKLKMGWEPFGVAITGPGMVTTWFKRQVEVPYEKPKEKPDE